MEELFAAARAGDVAAMRDAVARDPSLAAAHDEHGLSIVLAACFHRQWEVRDALLAADPPLDVLDAAATGRVERLRELLGADRAGALAARTPEGFDAISLAAFLGGAEAVRVLLEHGAPPEGDPANELGIRPVHAAVAARDARALGALLDAGADPDATQQRGITPLHAAAQHDDEALVRLLLDAGADPSLKAEDGRDAIAFAPDAGGVRALLRG